MESTRKDLDHQIWRIISHNRRLLVHRSRRGCTHQQSFGAVHSLLSAPARAVSRPSSVPFAAEGSIRIPKCLFGQVACSLYGLSMVRSVVALSSMFLANSLDSARILSIAKSPERGGVKLTLVWSHAMRHLSRRFFGSRLDFALREPAARLREKSPRTLQCSRVV